MKKIILLIAAMLSCGYSASVYAQGLNTKADLVREIIPLVSKAKQLVEEKDYKGAVATQKETLAALSLFSGDFMAPIGLEKELMYDMACNQALSGDSIGAMASLQTASALGWNDYRHALTDSDLDTLRGSRYFQGWLENLKNKDFLTILQLAPAYTPAPVDTLSFTYAPAKDKNLTKLRQRLRLDSVAGKGDEISRIKNLTTFVHNFIQHDGSNGNPTPMNGIAFADSCEGGKGTLNCRGMAMLLNECLLSMGIPSRYITCFPKVMENDCHVINAVWSSQLNKWIWMDPSFNAWVTDDKGNLLGIEEVRARIIAQQPLVVNPEANHYNNATTKDWYLDSYMTKNLYALEANRDYSFGAEDNDIHHYTKRKFAILVPEGFKPDYSKAVCVSDSASFWKAPR